jgi:hypothetical protein
VTFSHSPLHIAREAQHMAMNAKGRDSEAFQKGALVMMGVMVAASVGGVLLQLYRELNRKDGHDRGR